MAHVGFKALSAQLAAKGAANPDALAAHIGQKKYGKAAFAAMAAAARKKKGARSVCDRVLPFELRDASPDGGDGLTFTGYAAVFGSPTTIRDQLGEFSEQIAAGAFADSLRQKTPVLMFDHGKHPLIGQMPLGRITSAREDAHGLFVEARLTDNWLIQPVRDAIRDGAVSGMSFRFTVPDGGDVWSRDNSHREIRTASVSELGPVVFPAYAPTTAAIRSQLEHLPVIGTTDLTAGPGTRGAGGGDPRDAGRRDANPSPDAEARDRLLRMKGIIRG